jgi:hypothetical protein
MTKKAKNNFAGNFNVFFSSPLIPPPLQIDSGILSIRSEEGCSLFYCDLCVCSHCMVAVFLRVTLRVNTKMNMAILYRYMSCTMLTGTVSPVFLMLLCNAGVQEETLSVYGPDTRLT